MEIKFFMYDNNLDIYEFKKTFDIKTQIKGIPSFYNSKLYITKTKSVVYDEWERTNNNITFGSIISFDCNEETLKKIDTWYLTCGYRKRKIIEVTPIGFTSVNNFLKGKYKIFKKERCVAYVLDKDSEVCKKFRNNRHFKYYEFHRRFLITYKK